MCLLYLHAVEPSNRSELCACLQYELLCMLCLIILHKTHCRRPGEVLIKVAAASINPIDFKTRGAHGGVPKFAVTLPKVTGFSTTGFKPV
jgi:hypothetical protein